MSLKKNEVRALF
jgi:Ca2+-binding EF-hand superfamily protein